MADTRHASWLEYTTVCAFEGIGMFKVGDWVLKQRGALSPYIGVVTEVRSAPGMPQQAVYLVGRVVWGPRWIYGSFGSEAECYRLLTPVEQVKVQMLGGKFDLSLLGD